MRPADNINELIKGLHLKASADLDRKVHDDISNALAKSKKTASAHSEPNIWRIIMKSKMIKLATAAAIIVAALVGVHQFGRSVESIAFADIVEPFLTARTATFKIRLTGQGVPAQEYDGMFLAPCRMRHTQPGGGTVIVDLEKGKFVTLLPQLKQAVVLELINVPEDPGSLNFFQEIRNRILKAKPLDDESVKFLG